MRDYEENLEKYLEQIKKFTKEIIFKNQEIKHDIHIPYSNGIPRILFQIYVDIDKMYKGSPTYDKEYQGIIKQLDFEIKDISKYFNIPTQQLEPHYTYINYDFTKEIVSKSQHEWYLILMDEYGIRRDLLEQYEFMVDLILDPDYVSDTRIVAWCQYINNTEVFYDVNLDCDKIESVVISVLENNGVMDSGLLVHIGVCEEYDY